VCFGASFLRIISKGGSLKIRVRIRMFGRFLIYGVFFCLFTDAGVQAYTFTDNFDTPYNYLTGGKRFDNNFREALRD